MADEEGSSHGSGNGYGRNSRNSTPAYTDMDGEEKTDSEGETAEEYRDPMRDAKVLFPWHGNQKELVKELLCALELEDEKTEVKKALDLFDSLIFQTVGDRPFSSALIYFLAILGIDEETSRLRVSGDFSYMLVGAVYCTRVLAAEILLPSAERDNQGEAERQQFLQKRCHYLANGLYSPMSTTISLLAYDSPAIPFYYFPLVPSFHLMLFNYIRHSLIPSDIGFYPGDRKS